LHAKLGEFHPSNNSGAGANPGDNSAAGGKLGVAVEPLTEDMSSQLGLPASTRGLVVNSVDPSGAAAEAGIQPGDVIVQINRLPVHSTSDVSAALAKSSDRPALLQINRKGQTVFVPVRVH